MKCKARTLYYSATDLAGLPGLPTTVRGITKMAEREEWESIPRFGSGGGRVYAETSLPPEVRVALRSQYLGVIRPEPMLDPVRLRKLAKKLRELSADVDELLNGPRS